MLNRYLIDLLGGRGALARTVGKDCSQFVSTLPGFDKVAFGSIGSLLSTLTGAFILIAGIGTFIFIIIGGVQYLTSGGDKAATQNARERITYAIIGLAIVASAVAVNQVIGAIFGVNIFGQIVFPKADSIVGDLGVCN
jgi:hypothetical protein